MKKNEIVITRDSLTIADNHQLTNETEYIEVRDLMSKLQMMKIDSAFGSYVERDKFTKILTEWLESNQNRKFCSDSGDRYVEGGHNF